jgi:drug/metabolite transporter (DMT)-like permease
VTRGERPPRAAWIAWATVCVVWGTTYLAIKVALETIPPFTIAGLRFTIAGVLVLGLAAWQGEKLPAPHAWPRLIAVSLLSMCIANGGVVWAQQYVPTGLSAVMIATTPFWMVGIDAVLKAAKQLFARQWTGLGVGFLGIVVLVWPEIATDRPDAVRFLWGVLSLQISCAGWSLAAAYNRRATVRSGVLGAAAAQMLSGGIVMLLIGWTLGETSRVSFVPHTALAMGYLVFVGSVIGFTSFSYALQHLDVAIVGMYTYVNPVIAVALGTLVLGEPFHSRLIGAGVIIAAGIAIVGTPGGNGTRVATE